MTVLVGTYFSIVLKRRGYVSRCTRVSTGQRAMVGVAAVVGLRRRGLHHRRWRENSDADLVCGGSQRGRGL